MVTTTGTLRLAHSPDCDDAFMFYALMSHKIDAEGLEFSNVLRDIETLNKMAAGKELDVTAISVHAYAYLCDNWALLSSGASMGDRYGPMVVTRNPMDRETLRRTRIAIPGEQTSATLALRMAIGDFPFEVRPFDEILEAVAEGSCDAGLLIHEGQLTYKKYSLTSALELGQWWHEETGLPLPLGVNAISKGLPRETRESVDRVLRRSIEYGLAHRQQALEYALRFARDLKPELADRFVGMYVNEHTVDYGADGKKAIRLFLRRGYEAGLLPSLVEPEFVSGD